MACSCFHGYLKSLTPAQIGRLSYLQLAPVVERDAPDLVLGPVSG